MLLLSPSKIHPFQYYLLCSIMGKYVGIKALTFIKSYSLFSIINYECNSLKKKKNVGIRFLPEKLKQIQFQWSVWPSMLTITSATIFFKMQTWRMERMKKNEIKTTKSDTMNSSFLSSGSFKDFSLGLRSAFPRNEIRSFPVLLTKVQSREPSQGLLPFCSGLQSKS